MHLSAVPGKKKRGVRPGGLRSKVSEKSVYEKRLPFSYDHESNLFYREGRGGREETRGVVEAGLLNPFYCYKLIGASIAYGPREGLAPALPMCVGQGEKGSLSKTGSYV